METTRSRDGTTIAFDRSGDGPPVIVVGGATCDRAMIRPLAEELAKHFTVINYDRRGRGDSGDIAPYAVELFFTTVGMPREMVDQMRHAPTWAGLEAMAPKLASDSGVMATSAGVARFRPTCSVPRPSPPSSCVAGRAPIGWST